MESRLRELARYCDKDYCGFEEELHIMKRYIDILQTEAWLTDYTDMEKMDVLDEIGETCSKMDNFLELLNRRLIILQTLIEEVGTHSTGKEEYDV